MLLLTRTEIKWHFCAVNRSLLYKSQNHNKFTFYVIHNEYYNDFHDACFQTTHHEISCNRKKKEKLTKKCCYYAGEQKKKKVDIIEPSSIHIMINCPICRDLMLIIDLLNNRNQNKTKPKPEKDAADRGPITFAITFLKPLFFACYFSFH